MKLGFSAPFLLNLLDCDDCCYEQKKWCFICFLDVMHVLEAWFLVFLLKNASFVGLLPMNFA